MDLPLVSVVIPCRNRPDDVRRVIDDLRHQDYPRMEIIIIDDGSSPPLPHLDVEAQLRHEQSLGVSAARNAGLDVARGELIVGLDDDVTLQREDFISSAVSIAREHPGAAVIGFRQRRPDGSLHYLQPAQCDQLCRTAKFFGYGFLLRRTALDRVGTFFPMLAFGGEEIELSIRILGAGYEILYAPSLELVHHESAIGRDWRRMRRLTLGAQYFATILRHPWWFIVPSLAVQTARFISMTAKTEGVEWRAIGFAAAETVRNFSRLWSERKAVPFATLLRNRQLNRNPELVGGGVSESNRPFDASAPKQRF